MYDEERPYTELDNRYDKEKRRGYWELAKGLQRCDGLEVSQRAEKQAELYIEGTFSAQEAAGAIEGAYNAVGDVKGDRQAEADVVSLRIVSLLETGRFELSPSTLRMIHSRLFEGVFEDSRWAGEYRRVNLSKPEPVLGGRSVQYADFSQIKDTLEYDFGEEARRTRRYPLTEKDVDSIAQFISRVWQTHPFREGNTRTTAVFTELYLRSLGYEIDNEEFAQNSTFFRDALVRANFASFKNDINFDASFIKAFLRNVVLGEKNDISSMDLNIHGIRVNDIPYRSAGEYADRRPIAGKGPRSQPEESPSTRSDKRKSARLAASASPASLGAPKRD